MVNYQQGKIYKIVCNTTGLVYVGSTCEQRLSQRLARHVLNYKKFLNAKYCDCASFEIIKNENYEIMLLESHPCNNKDELLMRERHYIEETECVNIRRRPITTVEEKKEYKKNYGQKRYSKNKEEVHERNKSYYIDNKDKVNKANREYYYANKEHMDKLSREYSHKRRLYLQQLKYYNI